MKTLLIILSLTLLQSCEERDYSAAYQELNDLRSENSRMKNEIATLHMQYSECTRERLKNSWEHYIKGLSDRPRTEQEKEGCMQFSRRLEKMNVKLDRETWQFCDVKFPVKKCEEGCAK